MGFGPKDRSWWYPENVTEVAAKLGYVPDMPFLRAMAEYQMDRVDGAVLTDSLLVMAGPFFSNYDPPLTRVRKSSG